MKHDTANAERKQPQLEQREAMQQALSQAETLDDFFGKEGLLARLFADTVEAMLEAEMTEHLGYERYEAKGRNTGNSRNGSYPAPLRTSTGDVTIQKPRDRQGTFQSRLVEKT